MKIDNFQHELIFRSLGGSGPRERIGAGFMDKRGVKLDFARWDIPYYALIYVLEGEGSFTDEHGNVYELYPGCFFQRFPMSAHSNSINPKSGWKECFIDIGENLFNALLLNRVIIPDTKAGFIGSVPEIPEKIKKIILALKTTEEEYLPFLVPDTVSIVSLFFENLKRRRGGSRDDIMIEKACEELGRNLHQRVNIKKFCLKNGWGYEKFRKLFAGRTGISPGRYRVRRRIDEACRLLNMPGLSIAEAAEILGYPSPYEFSAQFKKYTGTSPREFKHGK